MQEATREGNERMITNDLQNRIHFGDREAFLAVYDEYGRGVYAAALKALRSDALAKSAVKQTFLTLYEELLSQTEDFDIPVRIRELTEREILLLRLVSGAVDGAAELPAETSPEPEQFSARGAFSAEDGAPLDLPPLERERSFRRPDKALFAKKRRKKRDRRRGVFGKALLVLTVLVLLWALAGVLMELGYLPALDLAYGWFSRTVRPLFTPLP